MREIKFRAWDKDKKEMFDYTRDYRGDYDEYWGDAYALQVGLITNISKDERFILMQYTGLHDKHGKEIWESDIVTNGDETLVIGWNQLHNAWCFFDAGMGMRGDIVADWVNEDGSCPKQWEIKEWEVIGNVFENADLLK